MKFTILVLFLFAGLNSRAQVKTLKASDGSIATVNGPLKFKAITVGLDTTTRPDWAMIDIYIPAISGSNMNEMMAADHSYTVTDKNGKPVAFQQKVLKKINGAMEDNIVNYTMKIPYKLKKDGAKDLVVHYKMETKDKAKSLSMSIPVKY